MKLNLITKISSFFIGISFILRLHSPIAFGTSIGIGILLIIFEQRTNLSNWIGVLKNSRIFPFLLLFATLIFFSSLTSIKPIRSFLVSMYLIFFISTGFIVFQHFKNNLNALKLTCLLTVISVTSGSLIIVFYNIYYINFSGLGIPKDESNNFLEVLKYKGISNLFILLICILPVFETIFKKTRNISYLLFILIIPIITTTNNNAAILGIFCSLLLIFFWTLIKNSKRKKLSLMGIALLSIISTSIFLNFLPKKFDNNSIQSMEFRIPTSIIDPHRQIIWGFSLQEIKKNWLWGIGPDSSNFIEEGQRTIGHQNTGTMNFIPSHPHNFLIELILEIGLLGTFSFILLILSINYLILINVKKKVKYLLIFNGYFWGSSLVNFSFWNAWWQGSYFLILAILTAILLNVNKPQLNFKNNV